jgi:hypothetical protein
MGDADRELAGGLAAGWQRGWRRLISAMGQGSSQTLWPLAVSLAGGWFLFVQVRWVIEKQYVEANYGFAAIIGVATGATELLSRYRDRPFAAVTSFPGAAYMLINAGAAVLALYLMIVWKVMEHNQVQRTLVAWLFGDGGVPLGPVHGAGCGQGRRDRFQHRAQGAARRGRSRI